MNENIENRIIELIDAGKTAENSSELKDIIESSDEAKQFYYNFVDVSSSSMVLVHVPKPKGVLHTVCGSA